MNDMSWQKFSNASLTELIFSIFLNELKACLGLTQFALPFLEGIFTLFQPIIILLIGKKNPGWESFYYYFYSLTATQNVGVSLLAYGIFTRVCVHV